MHTDNIYPVIQVIQWIAFIFFLIVVLPRVFNRDFFWMKKKDSFHVNVKKPKNNGWKSPGEIKFYANATYNDGHKRNLGPYATLPYTIRFSLLSHQVMEFYTILLRILKDQPYTIAIKPRICDFVYVSFERYSNQDDYDYFNSRIKAIGIDFLICDRDSLKPRLAIKLNTDSYKPPDDLSDDRFIEKLFQTLGLKYLTIHTYSTETLKTQISEALLLRLHA